MNKLNIIRSIENLKDNGSNLYTKAIQNRCNLENINTKISIVSNQEELDFITSLQNPYIIMQPCELNISDYINDKYNMEKSLTANAVLDICKETIVLGILGTMEKNVLIINRSSLIGRPLSNLLLDNDFTVMVAHSKTNSFSLKEMINTSDIIVLATGQDMTYLNLNNKVVIDISNDYRNNNKKLTRYYDRKEVGKRTIDKLIHNIKNMD